MEVMIYTPELKYLYQNIVTIVLLLLSYHVGFMLIAIALAWFTASIKGNLLILSLCCSHTVYQSRNSDKCDSIEHDKSVWTGAECDVHL